MNMIIILAIIIVLIVVWLYNELNKFGRCNICGGTIRRYDRNGYRHFICQGCGNEIIIKLPNKNKLK